MQALDLEFARQRPRSLAVYALAVFSVAFLADALLHHRELRAQLQQKEVLLARRALAQPSAQSVAAPVASPQEYAFARDTIARLSTPWNELFAALEAAQIDDVALVALEPDLEARSVTISAEAKSYLAALSYVAAASDQQFLRHVHLLSHETKDQPPRPLKFALSARWKEPR
jgi:hypothetical protein